MTPPRTGAWRAPSGRGGTAARWRRTTYGFRWAGRIGLAVCCGVAGAAPGGLEMPLVVTQRPVSGTPTSPATSAIRPVDFTGARLVVVSPDGTERILSRTFHSACDPNVSFDGQHVLFAGRWDATAPWRVYEIGVDGQGARPVSPEGLEARHPIYVSTLFTLDSSEPWFTTVFEGRWLASADRKAAVWPSLFNVKLDGTELRHLTYHPGPAGDPFQQWDGRVLYAAARKPLEPGGGTERRSLFSIHVEGADMELYSGASSARVQRSPCATGSGWVVFVEAAEDRADGAGHLAAVHESRPHVLYRRLTEGTDWLYARPSPGPGSTALVARRPAEGRGHWAIVRVDPETRRVDPVLARPDQECLQAVMLAPRPRPDGHSTVVNTATNTGTFYGLNLYDADPRMASHLPAGSVKRVRLIETLATDGASDRSAGRRLLGEAPVESDGSYNVEVPASTPLLLQALDETGLALATCGSIWVQPKETRGCIGCHEDPERIPENHYVLALRRPSNRLVLPPAQRRMVTFREDVAPLLQQHCALADCHGNSDAALSLSLTSQPPAAGKLAQAYATLMRPRHGQSPASATAASEGRYVDAGRARTSWLVWQLLGRRASRPWDAPDPPSASDSRTVRPMPPPGKATPLRPEDVRTIIQWIDLGAPFEPPPAVSAP